MLKTYQVLDKKNGSVQFVHLLIIREIRASQNYDEKNSLTKLKFTRSEDTPRIY